MNSAKLCLSPHLCVNKHWEHSFLPLNSNQLTLENMKLGTHTEIHNVKILTGISPIQSIHFFQGIPIIRWHGHEGNYNVMIIELLGHSLEELFNLCGRQFRWIYICQHYHDRVTVWCYGFVNDTTVNCSSFVDKSNQQFGSHPTASSKGNDSVNVYQPLPPGSQQHHPFLISREVQ